MQQLIDTIYLQACKNIKMVTVQDIYACFYYDE
jgi:hypothetical protein